MTRVKPRLVGLALVAAGALLLSHGTPSRNIPPPPSAAEAAEELAMSPWARVRMLYARTLGPMLADARDLNPTVYGAALIPLGLVLTVRGRLRPSWD
jgi:hypothetical protein